jgi:hypothetical protein
MGEQVKDQGVERDGIVPLDVNELAQRGDAVCLQDKDLILREQLDV